MLHDLARISLEMAQIVVAEEVREDPARLVHGGGRARSAPPGRAPSREEPLSRSGKSRRSAARENPATRAYDEGMAQLRAHPVFRRLIDDVRWLRGPQSECPADGWLVAERDERMSIHPKRLADGGQRTQLMARGLLLHAMELWQPDHGDWQAWSTARDAVTARFTQGLKLGRAPEGMELPGGLPLWDEERWYRQLCEEPIPAWALALSMGGPSRPTMESPGHWRPVRQNWGPSWPENFAAGIAESVSRAVEVAAGVREELGGAVPTAPPPY